MQRPFDAKRIWGCLCEETTFNVTNTGHLISKTYVVMMPAEFPT